MLNFLKTYLDPSTKILKNIKPLLVKVSSLEEELKKSSDDDLKSRTNQFKNRFNKGESLETLLPEVFALVREVSTRTTGLRHFDVQIIGGVVLHKGMIAEMKTGEGKTLVATLPVCLNALTGEGVHIITVNEYLAKRDTEWMGPIYNFLGLKVGVTLHGQSHQEKKNAYQADITYGTNTEFGFDYLRDNMAIDKQEMVQRKLTYGIVDEVDSILIDEARTPLIIAGPSAESTTTYYRANRWATRLKEGKDFELDHKAKSATLTEAGIKQLENLLHVDNLYDPEHSSILRHITQSLRAHYLFKKDVNYVVKEGEVVIVDEFTGRMLPGRRYSDGLHQAIEAKENVLVREETQTLATISIQNYFRMYEKLAGMTGTAYTEAEEFRSIYGLETVAIPTNLPMIRVDNTDVVYKTEKGKFRAIIRDIVRNYQRGRPVLVGTRSIEKSEVLSSLLKRERVPHEVLNAKYHEKEASIIAKAGQNKAITIATNMAGRGVDIVLGDGIKDSGGLYVIGTERHESRRIDNQLRGRSGRQGDYGESRFYVSLDDELMKIFGGEMVQRLMERLSFPEDEPLDHALLSRAIETAQKRVEKYNFEIRKALINFDDVLNRQREFVYRERRNVLQSDRLKEQVLIFIKEIIDAYQKELEGDLASFEDIKKELLFIFASLPYDLSEATFNSETLTEYLVKKYQEREQQFGEDTLKSVEKFVFLRIIDEHFKEHLLNIDHIKEGIGLRAYAQKEPLVEFRYEAHRLFSEMMESTKREFLRILFHFQVKGPPQPASGVPKRK
ncbi:MAG: Protein translocase subunit SecA [candidate division WS2 bacterium]|uniref:Protein translocase subunit SecA n=1 Tax=Psychracetigena formicireducens TaxID=2986056 RepID=A0A9E2F5P5_PSYF1|nr:Protein translocase subunit SecA [Candidatus Psychracetigena formicireducens]MBT9144570.1 Protein translocase subunit SecA [Candidatus Psychracetigena formicireducens]